MEQEISNMIDEIESTAIRSLYKAVVQDNSIDSLTSICRILSLINGMEHYYLYDEYKEIEE